MHVSICLILSFSALAYAYQVVIPNALQGWTITGPNNLTWVDRNATNPLNFTAVLTNQDQTVMPLGDQVLAALVDGDLGTIIANPPSGGWPVGSGFRVNLVQDPQSLTTILAQSAEFNISTVNGSSTTSIASATVAATATTADASSSVVDPLAQPTPVYSGAQASPAFIMQAGVASAMTMLAIFFT